MKQICPALAVLAAAQAPATQAPSAQPRPLYRSAIVTRDFAGNTSQVLDEANAEWRAPNGPRDAGGQGTIDVNSWSPDSTRFAYVTYQVTPPR